MLDVDFKSVECSSLMITLMITLMLYDVTWMLYDVII